MLQYEAQKEVKLVWQLNTPVNMYDNVLPSNLKQIEIPASAYDKTMVIDKKEILNKIAKTQIPESSPIYSTDLIDKTDLGDKEFVILKTDYARTGGAKTGDTVSIYKIDKSKDWKEGTPQDKNGQIIIDNAIVVSITDANGRSIEEQKKQFSGIPLSSQTSLKIQAVRLAVPKGLSKEIVEAAVVDDNGYVLVVKGG